MNLWDAIALEAVYRSLLEAGLVTNDRLSLAKFDTVTVHGYSLSRYFRAGPVTT